MPQAKHRDRGLNDRPELAKLEAKGFKVHKFTEYHYRVDDRLDIFPADKIRAWAWHDLSLDVRGRCWPGDLHSFVPGYFEKNPVLETERLPVLGEKGRWFCPIQDCTFEMDDDGSAEASRKELEHLETH
jgi:hypothetical protein